MNFINTKDGAALAVDTIITNNVTDMIVKPTVLWVGKNFSSLRIGSLSTDRLVRFIILICQAAIERPHRCLLIPFLVEHGVDGHAEILAAKTLAVDQLRHVIARVRRHLFALGSKVLAGTLVQVFGEEERWQNSS